MTIHKHTLKENGVKLVSAMENIPDSPEGIILESLLEGYNNKNGHNIKIKSNLDSATKIRALILK